MKPCLNLNMSIQIISPSIVIASLVAVLMLYAYQYTLTYKIWVILLIELLNYPERHNNDIFCLG